MTTLLLLLLEANQNAFEKHGTQASSLTLGALTLSLSLSPLYYLYHSMAHRQADEGTPHLLPLAQERERYRRCLGVAAMDALVVH